MANKSKSTGRRAAKQAEVAGRPEKIRVMVSTTPMSCVDIARAFAFGDPKTATRMLTVLKRAGLVRDVVVTAAIRHWVAIGSPAEAQAQRMREENMAQKLAAKRARDREQLALLQQRTKDDRRAERIARNARKEARWLYPTKLYKPAGKWKATIPPGAVRSVFDLARV